MPRDWLHVGLVMRSREAGCPLDHVSIGGGAGPSAMIDAAAGSAVLSELGREIIEQVGARWDGRLSITRRRDGAHELETSFGRWVIDPDACATRAFVPEVITALGDSYLRRATARVELARSYGEPDAAWVLEAEQGRIVTPRGQLAVDLLAVYRQPELMLVPALAGLPARLVSRASALAARPDAPAWSRQPRRVVLHAVFAFELADLVGDALGLATIAWPRQEEIFYFGASKS